MTKALTQKEIVAVGEKCEEIAELISDVSEGMRTLLNGSLNERALVVLLHEVCLTKGSKRVGKTEIRSVLNGLVSLDEKFLSPLEDYDEDEDDEE